MRQTIFNQKRPRERRSLVNRIKDFFFWIRNMSILKHILFFYLLITILGALILWAPFSQQMHHSVGFVDSLFVAASGFSDTGLTTVVVAAEFNYFGQAILAILIVVGGVGWFALKVYLFNILLGRPIPLGTRVALSQERGSTTLGITNRLIKISLTAMAVAVIVGAIILSFYFYFIPGNFGQPTTYLENQNQNLQVSDYYRNGVWGFTDKFGDFHSNQEYNPYHNILDSIRFGIFHSITAINNAGFDIVGSHSLAPYYGDYVLQIILVGLLVFGGIGFPVIYDIYEWATARLFDRRTPFRFSLFTKISCVAYLIVTLVGLIGTALIEINTRSGLTATGVSLWNDPEFGTKSDKIMAIFFNTMSTRNAGFATVDYQAFNQATITLHAMLMFIGSAPSSTGGGIRTTTIAIVFLTVWKYIKNKSTVRAFNRQINQDTVIRSLVVLGTSLLLVIGVSIVLISSFQPNGGSVPEGAGIGKFDMNDMLFEVCSAFGTTGLSTGITPYLNVASKLILILVMFIGQLSVSSTLLVWGSRHPKSRHYNLYTEDVVTG